MNLSDLVFTGFNKRVAALNRHTGQIVWDWQAAKGSSFVSLLLDGDHLIVSVNGYTYALDALTGTQLWANEMRGFGYGVASLASVYGSTSALLLAAAEAAQQAAATSASTTAATTH